MPDLTEPPKKTKAERDAAKAARKLAKPVRDHPKKGTPKPKAKDGGTKNPKAKQRDPDEHPAARRHPDGALRLTMLDPSGTASEWIILEPAVTTP